MVMARGAGGYRPGWKNCRRAAQAGRETRPLPEAEGGIGEARGNDSREVGNGKEKNGGVDITL